jgi:hypothetical protein
MDKLRCTNVNEVLDYSLEMRAWEGDEMATLPDCIMYQVDSKRKSAAEDRDDKTWYSPLI